MGGILNPRSVLHALPAQGVNTPEVESLTSYMCRLAHSHGISVGQLARWMLERQEKVVPDNYKWCQRNFVSLDTETERWAACLSEVTGVGDLDKLSLVPFRHVFSTPGLTPKSDRWCPCCLAEDLQHGHEPYLRLVWDVAPVTVCLTHKAELVHRCPHCQRSNVRNRATVVVPGYCTACGGFLGEGATIPATPEALWIARQIGSLLANPPDSAESVQVTEVLREVVSRMTDGNVAKFAQRLDLSKSGVWNWVNRNVMPTIRAWLSISLHGGIPLDKLVSGDLDGWSPPVMSVQQCLSLPSSPRKGIQARTLDWSELTDQLQTILGEDIPITLAEAAKRIGVDVKSLYLRSNHEARAIAERYRQFERARKLQQEIALKNTLETVLAERRAMGYNGLSARDVSEYVKGSELANVRNTFTLIRNVLDGEQ